MKDQVVKSSSAGMEGPYYWGVTDLGYMFLDLFEAVI